jgi:hypothetical protein
MRNMGLTEQITNANRSSQSWLGVTGLALVIGGAMALIDQTFRLGWLEVLSIFAVGIVLLAGGIRTKGFGLVLAGGICSGLGLGISSAFLLMAGQPLEARIGIVITGLGLGFILSAAFIFIFHHQIIWWAAIPAGVLLGLGICLAFSQARLVDFALYIGLGLGVTFLGIGVYKRLFGLIIAGCILSSIGMGIDLSWGTVSGLNALARTGMMLVWFGLGWGLITVFSRTIIEKFVWWPLIPGAILAVVGWGLYIGGNPENALNFIRNTGSIAIIIFGIYLLLMRRGIRY